MSSSCENSCQEARVERQQFSGSIYFKNTFTVRFVYSCHVFFKTNFFLSNDFGVSLQMSFMAVCSSDD